MAGPTSLATAIPGAAASSLCDNNHQRPIALATPPRAALSFNGSHFLGVRLTYTTPTPTRPTPPHHRSALVVARLFGPAIFEASKLKVLFLGDGKDKRPDELPRAYTLTHSDVTAKLTLAVSQTINKAQIQGWYSRLQRDEVLAEWRKSQGSMSLHVHCHISGGHWVLDAIAKLRFYIFRKELPVVLEAFRYGDESLFKSHPELEEALVWVYFHSNVAEFNRVECWGPLREAAKGASEAAKEAIHKAMDQIEAVERKRPVRCPQACDCCFPPLSVIPLPPSFRDDDDDDRLPSSEQLASN